MVCYWQVIDHIKINLEIFLAVVMSVLLYDCTTWTLRKRFEKKLEDDNTRMLRAYKTAAVRPPTSHLTNRPRKTNKTSWVLSLEFLAQYQV